MTPPELSVNVTLATRAGPLLTSSASNPCAGLQYTSRARPLSQLAAVVPPREVSSLLEGSGTGRGGRLGWPPAFRWCACGLGDEGDGDGVAIGVVARPALSEFSSASCALTVATDISLLC